VNSDLELERTSRRPADKTCCLIGEEDMRNKPEWQAHDAYVQHQGIEKQQVNDAPAGPRTPAKAQVYQGEQHAQQSDDQADHLGRSSTTRARIGIGAPRALKSIALVHARLVLIHCLEVPLTLLTRPRGDRIETSAMSARGTKRTYRDVCYLAAFEGKDGVIGRQLVDS
jgi:hypothetical protein